MEECIHANTALAQSRLTLQRLENIDLVVKEHQSEISPSSGDVQKYDEKSDSTDSFVIYKRCFHVNNL